jgi:hypothetical protein
MDDPARDLERFKAQLQSELERYKVTLQAQQNQWLESIETNRHAWISGREDDRILVRAVIEFSSMTIRSLILVNGGAAIGILTFLGNLWNKDAPIAKASAIAIGPGLAGFIVGLSCALLTSGFAYLTQVAFSELSREGNNPARKWGNRLRVVAIIMALCSLVSFLLGAWKCMAVFIAPPFLK